jgi:hypothetical protein
MKDFIKRYQNHKMFTNLNIVLVSLVLAVWINFLLIDWTNIGQNLKTSVLDSTTSKQVADLYFKNIDWELYLISNKNLNDINTLSLSVSYNPEITNIIEITSEFWEILNLWTTPWINSIILNTESGKNIVIWDKILKIHASKKTQNSENINIVNANFTDIKKEQYLLSTSGITF